MHVNWTGKDISTNKIRDTIVTTFVGTSANRRNQVLHLGLHHLNPPSIDRNITKKRQAWEEHYVLQRDKGM